MIRGMHEEWCFALQLDDVVWWILLPLQVACEGVDLLSFIYNSATLGSTFTVVLSIYYAFLLQQVNTVISYILSICILKYT